MTLAASIINNERPFWQPPAQPAVVAREGSERAARLRAQGWVPRSGWRSRHSGWLLRFTPPADLNPTTQATSERFQVIERELTATC
jgi:hypothetical protein